MLFHYICITQRAKEFNCLYQNDVAVLWMLSDKHKGKTGEVWREVKIWCICACIVYIVQYTLCKSAKQSVEDGNFFKDGNGARWIDELEDALTRADGSVPRKSQH